MKNTRTYIECVAAYVEEHFDESFPQAVNIAECLNLSGDVQRDAVKVFNIMMGEI